MANLVTGTIRQAASYTKQNWRGLLSVTVIPLTLLIVFTIGYIITYIPFFSKFFELFLAMETGGGEPDLKAIEEIMSGMMFVQMLGLLATIITLFISGHVCVRIVRFYVRGETGVWRMDKKIAMASLMWALYTIGIYMLAIGAMFVAMLVMGVVAVPIGAITYSSVTGTGLISLLVILGAIGYFLVFFIPAAVAIRFASGMPVIALGESPDFFSEMWKQSRGYTWSLVWRFLLIYFVMTMAIIIVFGIVMGGPVIDLFSQFSSIAKADQISKIMEVISGLFPRFLFAQAVMMIVFAPFIWFGTIWLTMVNQRLYEAFKKPAGEKGLQSNDSA